MTRRVYRLGALLKHAGACREWSEFVRQFHTADEVLFAVNANPKAWIGDERAAASVRWFAVILSRAVYGTDAATTDRLRDARDGDDRHTPITPQERRRFLALWQRYADAHGLYEDVSDEVAA